MLVSCAGLRNGVFPQYILCGIARNGIRAQQQVLAIGWCPIRRERSRRSPPAEAWVASVCLQSRARWAEVWHRLL